MADHDEPDATQLASAYLDGEVSDDERVRVERDPALLAEVERLRRVRAVVGDVPAAESTGRESAIAAALAVFDEQHDGGAGQPSAPATIVPLDRRRRMRRMQGLTAVAAAAVLVIGGLVIANRDGGDDEATRAGEQQRAATIESGDAALVAPTTTGAPPTTISAPAPTATTPAAAPLVAEDTSSALEQADAPMAAAVPATSGEDGALTQAAEAPPPSVITDAGALAAFVASLDRPPPPVDEVLAACRAGELDDQPDATAITDDAVYDVAVASSPDGPVAVDLGDCTVVMRSPTGPADTDS
jgi:hypothetical protein